jgi:hypothetical protein
VPLDRVVLFYSGGRDDRGRTLDGILAWPDEELEAVHDYIQWVFPTIARSGVNPSAPLVTPSTIDAFAARPELREALGRSLDRMLAFYGLRRTTAAPDVVGIEMDPRRFADRAPHWLQPGNHNHLRLTRIVQSLSSLGLEREAAALQRCLCTDVYEGPGRARITRETLEHWKAALGP